MYFFFLQWQVGAQVCRKGLWANPNPQSPWDFKSNERKKNNVEIWAITDKLTYIMRALLMNKALLSTPAHHSFFATSDGVYTGRPEIKIYFHHRRPNEHLERRNSHSHAWCFMGHKWEGRCGRDLLQSDFCSKTPTWWSDGLMKALEYMDEWS